MVKMPNAFTTRLLESTVANVWMASVEMASLARILENVRNLMGHDT